MADTKIEWCTETWSPLEGCTRAGKDCLHCYAERQVRRLAEINPARYAGLVDPDPAGTWRGIAREFPERMEEPLHWRRARRVFVCPRSDIYHHTVTTEYRNQMFAIMRQTQQHRYLLLTKRPNQAARPGDVPTPANAWLGMSAGNQDVFEERLAAAPPWLRWLSMEPLLGPVAIGEALHRGVRWVVVGGESGPGARPCALEWLQDLRLQCAGAGVHCYVKQLGSCPTAAGDPVRYVHPKGGDPAEWPAYLRVRQFPAALLLPGEATETLELLTEGKPHAA